MKKFSKMLLFSLIALFFVKLSVGNKIYCGKIKIEPSTIVSSSPTALPVPSVTPTGIMSDAPFIL